MMSDKSKQYWSRDPFAVDPLPKAHYHPSRQKYLSQEKRQTAISPRRKEKTEKVGETVKRALSPTDELFLRHGSGLNLQDTGGQYLGEEQNFDESWPSTERPSSIGLMDHEETSPFSITKLLQRGTHTAKSADLKASFDFTDHLKGENSDVNRPVKEEEGSTLQRYIERFRKGTPMSREERQRKSGADSRDFWWISEDMPGSGVSEDRGRRGGGLSDNRGRGGGLSEEKLAEFSKQFEKRPRRDIPPPSPGDERTRRLQERAEKLLEKSVSSVCSSEPIVSTDGLGSTMGSMDSPGGTVSSFDEQPYRPIFARGEVSRKPERVPASKPDISYQPIKKPSRPEDDILYQWRIKRRLEVARTTAEKCPTTNKFGFLDRSKEQAEVDAKLREYTKKLSGSPAPPKISGPVNFTPAPSQRDIALHKREGSQPAAKDGPSKEKEYPQIASPILKRKPVGDDDGLEPHLHLMCDLLPCPHQEGYRDVQGMMQYGGSEGWEGRGGDRESREEDVQRRDAKSDRMTKLSENGDIDRQKNGHRIMAKDQTFRDKRYEYLEAEKPDEGLTERSDISRHKDDHTKTSGDDMGDKSSTQRPRRELNYEEDRLSQKSDRSVQSSRSNRSDSSDRSERSSQSKDSVSRKSRSRNELSDISQSSQQTGARDLSDSVDGARKSHSSRGRDDSMTSHAEKKTSRDRSSKPEHCKSPVTHSSKKPVDSAIGQVIKDRLFTSSVDTVATSFDSVSSLNQSEQVGKSCDSLPQKPPPTKISSSLSSRESVKLSQKEKVKEEENADDSYISDGEFGDDQLLGMLRQQRAQYEHQLSEIDRLLSSMK